MSELTICNFCSLNAIKIRANEIGAEVILKPGKGKLGGKDVFVVQKGEVLDDRVDPKTGNHLSGQWTAWMWEIPDHCCC